VGKNLELGKDNKLLFNIKEDMKFFKESTMGHPILMGRKTYESIGRALPGRTNYVITRHPEDLPTDVEPVKDLKEFLEKYQNEEKVELFVIGGAMVYTEALKYADKLYLTRIDKEVPDADTRFPNFNEDDYEKIMLTKGSQDDLNFEIIKYIKKGV
ncbi:dihydrofolate reductase, partial [Candidatus Saccharibacteria bacterium]|nr:dihydrofolate reductase [Candidatus Saccharibacteria bacterium]